MRHVKFNILLNNYTNFKSTPFYNKPPGKKSSDILNNQTLKMATGLKSEAFTGDSSKGNPYQGDIKKGIAYDAYEAESNIIEQKRDYPQILKPYQAVVQRLIKGFSATPYFSVINGDIVLDVGSGTGISTLELLSQYHGITVLGLELSPGMLEVANYKFHKNNGKKLLSHVTNQRLLDYWNEFREKSEKYKNQVNFILGDIQTTHEIALESIDCVIANQVLHWTDLSVSFRQFDRFLETNGQVLWNTASHFYNDSKFPSEKYGFRYNDFLGFVMDEVAKKANVKNYKSEI
jgi:ubiquinone/menaquinone biosynthesis C-methylase UbiE